MEFSSTFPSVDVIGCSHHDFSVLRPFASLGRLFLLHQHSLLYFPLPLFQLLNFVELLIRVLSFCVFLQVVINELAMFFFVAPFGGFDGVAFNHVADLDIGGKFLDLSGLAGDISGVDVTFEFEEDQVVLDILQLLVALECVVC